MVTARAERACPYCGRRAKRVCGCGAELVEKRPAGLWCPRCGAEARRWLVQLGGRFVAAADFSEVVLLPDFLSERLSQEVLAAAAARAGRES